MTPGLTPYDLWQQEKYGDILHEFEDMLWVTGEPEDFESCIDEEIRLTNN